MRSSWFNHRRGVPAACALAVLVLVAGCPMVVPGDGDGGDNNNDNDAPVDTPSNFIDGNFDGSLTSPLGKTAGEPNDSFSEAVVAVFDETGSARVKGTVARSSDLDVFLLGALEVGDRLVIDATTRKSNLDVSVAVFDEQERLTFNNDDRTGSNLDSFGDFIVRHAGARYYLVVTGSAFAASGQSTGTYTVEIQKSSGATVPAPRPQVLVLDFDGGAITSGPLSPESFQPFDAGQIDTIYEGASQEMKDAILAVVRANFARFDVVVHSTDEGSLPAGTVFTTIFFGNFSDFAFGIAEDVDLYNVHRCDDGIIYTESFSPRVFSFNPTVEEMAIAIGNVATHEAGHLLGLNHVDDDRDLMDDQSPADVFITDQEFMEAPLSSDIMPIGTQDGVLLLAESVGLIDGA